MKTFNDYIKSIKDGNDLSVDESESAFDQILLQKAEDNEIIDFLTSLSKKGESVNEIFGAVTSIKKKANIEGVLYQKTLSIQEGAQLKIKTETYK